MSDNLHDGHRDRVKDKFLENGFTKETPEHEILELILFYSVPRKDTNELAHKLLNEFGSLAGVLNAKPDQLMKVVGITKNTAVLFKMILETARGYNAEMMSHKNIFKTNEEIGEYILSQFIGVTDERFSLLSLSNNGKLLSYDIVSVGDISSVGVSTRKIIEIVLRTRATTVVIAHNHPGGLALPSATDLETTKCIAEALKHIGVYLHDHIIVADGDFVSLAQSKDFRELFK